MTIQWTAIDYDSLGIVYVQLDRHRRPVRPGSFVDGVYVETDTTRELPIVQAAVAEVWTDAVKASWKQRCMEQQATIEANAKREAADTIEREREADAKLTGRAKALLTAAGLDIDAIASRRTTKP